jgi:nucleotide-binding universal stress UspA family protein
MSEAQTTEQLPPAAALLVGDALCAVDGSPGSIAAVEQAAALAGAGGHLTVLEVTSFRSEGEYRSPAVSPGESKAILDRAKSLAHDRGVSATVEVDPASPPWRVILEWSFDHALLAMGAPNTSWFAGTFIHGDTTDAALRDLATPVLVARAVAGGRRFAEQIVVASDGLPGSDELVEFAAQLARAQGAKVTLLHATGHERSDARERIKVQAQRLDLFGDLDSDVRIEPGPARTVIPAVAAASDASLIVMGSRALRGLRLIGSVSRRVAHDAHCSVLLVPPEALRRDRPAD